jgi:cytidine deaminase
MDSVSHEIKDGVISQVLLDELNGLLTADEIKRMIDLAVSAKENSYSPYSKFRVGSCLLTEDGKYFQGTNVENISYGLSICAERSAMCCSVTEGHKDLKAAVVTTDADYFVSPCGACRQFLVEFGIKICILLSNDYKITYIKGDTLLPLSFVFTPK